MSLQVEDHIQMNWRSTAGVSHVARMDADLLY